MKTDKILAIGLMSGTSMDGVDCALIESDGEDVDIVGNAVHIPYTVEFRRQITQGMKLAALCDRPTDQVAPLNELEEKLTLIHAEAVHELLTENGLSPGDVQVVGFHGQTLVHRPEEGWTWQIGDGQALADMVRIPVVNDFRQRDMKKGGQGAPLVPIYHQALVRAQAQDNYPVAVVNIGGVSNISWIGCDRPGRMLAFDTGPGNALLDDWVNRHTGEAMDVDGRLAAAGKVNQTLLDQWLENSYFYKLPPKSLDRHTVTTPGLDTLTLEDGAATLLEFTVRTIEISLKFCPTKPRNIYVCGGGRCNKTLMKNLGQLSTPVHRVEDLGWRGDFLEAEAFAFLACRHLFDLPLTYPGTTGAYQPSRGGTLYEPMTAVVD